MAVSEDFTNPGQGPDYRIGSDGPAATNGWRRETPSFLEDGSVPDRRFTVAPGSGIVAVTGGGEPPPRIRRENTFDLEME